MESTGSRPQGYEARASAFGSAPGYKILWTAHEKLGDLKEAESWAERSLAGSVAGWLNLSKIIGALLFTVADLLLHLVFLHIEPATKRSEWRHCKDEQEE